MSLERIVDATDARLAGYRGISDAKLLRERNLFVAEGRLVVERVLRDRRYCVDSLLLNPAAFEALRPVLVSSSPESASTFETRDTPVPVYVADTSLFEPLTGYNIHRGCLALVRRPPAANWQDLAAKARLIVVLEGVTDADNVGSVFRNAAAFGADAVLLSPGTCDPLYRKAVRTSMGAALSVPFARIEPWPEAISTLKSLGCTVVALSPREPSITLDEFAHAHRENRCAVVIGTEGRGLSTDVETIADALVRIPTCDSVDSLNLSVATGIALYVLTPVPQRGAGARGV